MAQLENNGGDSFVHVAEDKPMAHHNSQSSVHHELARTSFSLAFQIQLDFRPFAMFLAKTWRAATFGLYGYLNFTKSGFLEHSKKFNPEDMQAQMEAKNCVVTGANSGIGFAITEGFASRGATVYMVCRNKERGEAALSKIKSATGNKNVYLEVNNAGVLENNRVTTPEGYEQNFAVNVLGTYTITELMLPLLEKAAPDARVITVSSGGMYTAPLTKDLQASIFQVSISSILLGQLYSDGLFLQFSDNQFNGAVQYAQNKRVQVALTEKWSEMHKDKGIGFYSMHPGWAETPGVTQSLPSFSKSLEGKLRTSEEGADTVIWLALQPKEKLVSGAFYFDRAEASKHLLFSGTKNSHSEIDSIVENLRSLAGLSGARL